MKTFMDYLSEVAGTIDRTIIVQRVGQTPPNVDQNGGYSVWFWDSKDGEHPIGELKISYPIQKIEKLQRDQNYQYVRLHCAYNKIYSTKLPYQVINDLENKLYQLELAKQKKAGPQQAWQARIAQQRQVG